MNVALPGRQLRTMHLFAGAGGGILADLLLGHVPVCAVEIEDYPRRVLLARQRDGILPRFPIWDDVRTFDGRPWQGLVDCVSGGFPCQDISSAGNGAGITGERSGLWREMARVIGEVRPRFVFVENSPMLTVRGLSVVLGDLSELGFDAEWGVLGGHNAGLPHRRERLWLVATSDSYKNNDHSPKAKRRDNPDQLRVYTTLPWETYIEPWIERIPDFERDQAYSDAHRDYYGLDSGVDRFAAIGNGQIPIVAALAWRILNG